ncbi:EF-hand [Leucogyrophana mollusca]|uniref:EF-hand n=1 Tax=Leucogyrophana mollusca TaxID=85980 RepID=A0ACB8BYB7_9AGAM|nr:EF-hand [Leucogyrophana mollusca]
MSRYPDYLSPTTTPSKLSKSQKSRARREPSGVFSLFQAPQIQQFKEAFQLIDHDKDGWVMESDLREIFNSLGISPSKTMMDDLLSARPGGPGHSKSPSASSAYDDSVAADRGINFTMFLTMMSERLFEFDPEADLMEAFECFDEGDTGMVKIDEMRKWMSEVGERMDQREVRYPCIDKFLKGSFTDRQGNFNYREWIKVLRVNDDGEEAEPQS